MTTIEKLRALACELAGEAWDYDRRRLPRRRMSAEKLPKSGDEPS